MVPLINLKLNLVLMKMVLLYLIVLMGKNGSGKTLILAQILQALLNNKSEQYNNILEKEKNQLYKVISTSYIKNNKQEGIISIDFDDNNFNYAEILSKNPQSTIDNDTFHEFTNKLRNDSDLKKMECMKQKVEN